jgi:hypothetical protein
MSALPDLDELLEGAAPVKAGEPTSSAFDVVLTALGRRGDTPEARRIPLPAPSASAVPPGAQDSGDADPGRAAVLAALRDLPPRPTSGENADGDEFGAESLTAPEQHTLTSITSSFRLAMEADQAVVANDSTGGVASFLAVTEVEQYTAELWAAVLDGAEVLPAPPAGAVRTEVASPPPTTTTSRVGEGRESLCDEPPPPASTGPVHEKHQLGRATMHLGMAAAGESDDDDGTAIVDTRQLRAAMKQAARGRVGMAGAAC